MKNINNESLGDGLLDAIGDISDDLVAESASAKVHLPMLYRKIWITAAVLICTLALFGGALHMSARHASSPELPVTTASESYPAETESEESITSAPASTETAIVSQVMTEEAPTSAPITEPEDTVAPDTTETTTPTSPSESTYPTEPQKPGDTIAGVIDPPSTTPSARPPETTVAPTEPITPPETRPEDYKTVKGPESGISEAYVLGKNFSSSSIQNGEPIELPPDITFESKYNFTIKATVVKNLPDVYYIYSDSSDYPKEYRVILMKTEYVINGKEMPEYFYYAIPNHLYVDMSAYDFLFISMYQRGTDGFVMVNSSDMRHESFPLPVFTSSKPEYGSIISFTDGIFDESLWQTPSWIGGYQLAEYKLDNPELFPDFMVKRGCTAEYTLERIKPDDRTREPTVITLAYLKDIDDAGTSYVTDFANGTFIQYFSRYYNTVTFKRVIYGCDTDEVLAFNTDKNTAAWSGTRYSPEDLATLTNLSNYIKELEAKYLASTPVSPHVSPDAATLRQLRISGHYFEHNGKIYEVVKTHWYYMDRNYETDLETTYIDEVFVILENGTPRDISREELLALEPPFSVYIGDYSAMVDHIIHE